MLANHRTASLERIMEECAGRRTVPGRNVDGERVLGHGCSGDHAQERQGWSTLWLYGDPRVIDSDSRSFAKRRVSQ